MLFLSILMDKTAFVKRGEGMEYEVVKKWLDELVFDYNASTKKRVLTSGVCATINEDLWVRFTNGIDVVAKIMGLELKEELMNNDMRVWYVYSFVYNGVKFVHYDSKRLAGYGDTE
jgi:hypothetical protein